MKWLRKYCTELCSFSINRHYEARGIIDLTLTEKIAVSEETGRRRGALLGVIDCVCKEAIMGRKGGCDINLGRSTSRIRSAF